MTLDLFYRRELLFHPVRQRLPIRRACRFLYASDLHLAPWTGHINLHLIEAARLWRPDFIALGGDLVDVPWALPQLLELVRQLATLTVVVAITGNHDALMGRARVCRTLRQGGAVVLEEPWKHPASQLLVHGAIDAATPQSVLIAHNPDIFPQAAGAGFPLILAGHLHGCQLILWEADGFQYPGAWFFGYNGREFSRQTGKTSSHMIVSLGVNDTLPIRWNCPREVLAVEILPEE